MKRCTVVAKIFAGLGGLLLAMPLAAQGRPQVPRTADELVSAVIRESEMPAATQSTTAHLTLTYVLLHHPDYPGSYIEDVLRRLEGLALAADAPELRASAVSYIALASSARSVRPMGGVMARLERVYGQSRDPLVRSAVVGAMGVLAADRPAALAFLERLAVAQNAEFPGSAEVALGSLVALGEEGRGVLKRLHDSNAVRDPEARRKLLVLASRRYHLQ